MIQVRTPDELQQMRPAGAFVAEVLTALEKAARPGVNLLELDALAHAMIRERGATSCYLDYHPSFGASPFGKVLCTSVNDAVLHGLPRDQVLAEGDLLSLDFACAVDGWVADSALTLGVGGLRPEDAELIAATEEALAAALEVATPAHTLGDVGHAVEQVLRRYDVSTDLRFGGHGVGRTMHEEPHVANAGLPGEGQRLRPGLVIAIEPWVFGGSGGIHTDPDGWTIRTDSGARGAHSEHTVAITEEGPLVLTQRTSR